MPGPKPTQSIDAAAMTKTNTIKIRTNFITTHLPVLDTTMTIKSYPSSSGGRLPIPPARSTAPSTSPQAVQKATVTAGVAGITPKSITPTTNSATNTSTPQTIPHRETYIGAALSQPKNRNAPHAKTKPTQSPATRDSPSYTAQPVAKAKTMMKKEPLARLSANRRTPLLMVLLAASHPAAPY